MALDFDAHLGAMLDAVGDPDRLDVLADMADEEKEAAADEDETPPDPAAIARVADHLRSVVRQRLRAGGAHQFTEGCGCGACRRFCQEGPNAGKPGPCPEGGETPAVKAPAAAGVPGGKRVHERQKEISARASDQSLRTLARVRDNPHPGTIAAANYDNERLHDDLATQTKANFGGRYRALADRTRQEFGQEVLRSPEWQAVRSAFGRHQQAALEALDTRKGAVGAAIDGLASGRYSAQDVRDEMAELNAADRSNASAWVADLQKTLGAFTAAHRKGDSLPTGRSHAEWEAFCTEGPNAGKPGPCPKPKEDKGKAKPKPAAKAQPKPTPAAGPSKAEAKKAEAAKAAAMAKAIFANPDKASPEAVEFLATSLSNMTVPELKALRGQLGVAGKVGAAKRAVVDSIKADALARIGAAKKPAAAPAPAAAPSLSPAAPASPAAFLGSLQRLGPEEALARGANQDEAHVLPPGGVTPPPWDRKRVREISRQARSGEMDAEYQSIDPKDVVFTQKFGVEEERLKEMVAQGPPSEKLRDVGRQGAPVVARGEDGRLYLLDGNHRALWAMAYGEPIKVLVTKPAQAQTQAEAPGPPSGERLAAALELATEGERGEDGRLTPSAAALVRAALGVEG